MGDPTDFFFFRVTTGGGVRRADFWKDGAYFKATLTKAKTPKEINYGL